MFKSTFQFSLMTLLLSLGLMGCLNMNEETLEEKTVVEEVGQLAFSNLNGASSLTQTIDATQAVSMATSNGLGGSQQGAAPVGAKRAVSSASAEEITIDSSEMATKGEVTVTINQSDALQDAEMVIVFKCQSNVGQCMEYMDSLANPTNVVSVKSTVTKKISQRVEEIEITDLDGDGIAAGAANYSNNAKLNMTSTYPFLGKQYVESAEMHINSGDDKDFGDEEKRPAASLDNRIIKIQWSKTRDGEVIESSEFTDEDGDGYIMDPNRANPSIVKIKITESGNPFKPFVKSSELNLTVEIPSENPDDGKIVAMSGKENMITGRVNMISVKNAADDSDIIVPNSDALVSLTTEFPVEEDSLIKSELKILMNVGSGLEDSTDNLLKEIHAVHEAKIGPVKVASFDFIANPPVPHGQEPEGGEIKMSVEFRNGDSFTIEGTIGTDRITLTIKAESGETFTGTWDKDGNLLEEDSNS